MLTNTTKSRIALLISILILSLGMKPNNSDQAVRIHIVGVSKMATNVPSVLLEENGKVSKLKTLHPLVKDSIAKFYEVNIKEIVYLVETMRLSGYQLVDHQSLQEADPNQSAIVFEFARVGEEI